MDVVIPAISKGGSLILERKAIIMAYYSGLSEQVILNHAYGSYKFLLKELRDKGLTVGRLDSRYRDRPN